MDKIQINRLEMARAVKNFLDGNATVWSSIPVMVSTKNTMDGLLDGIREQAEKQEDSRVRVGASKNEKKKNICVKIDILNDAVEAYAGINNKPDLADRAEKVPRTSFACATRTLSPHPKTRLPWWKV